MWMYVDAWNGFMIYPKNYQHVFATVTCLRKHPEWKKGFACRQRHPLNEFMDVWGSPQLGTPRIMSKLMYSKLSKLSWSQSSAGSQSVCVCFCVAKRSTLRETNISHLGKRKIIFKMPCLGDMLVPWRVSVETLLPFLAIFITSQCFGIPELFQSGQFRALPTLIVSLGFCCLPLVSVVQIQRSFRLDHFLSNVDMFNWC